VPRSEIDRIREKIRLRQYDMSAHAMEEMAEDFITILDVEEAVLSGQIIRVEKDDPRGTKYTVVGTALDRKTPVGVVGRFASTGRYLIDLSEKEGESLLQSESMHHFWRCLIITVYEVTELED
jgi:ATP-dependent DNA ligase